MDEDNSKKELEEKQKELEEIQNNLEDKELKGTTEMSNKKFLLKKYVSFTGRINRKSFIIYSLYLLVVTVLIYLFLTMFMAAIFGGSKITSLVHSALLLALTFIAMYANVSLSARRFLDLGIDSRWLFLVFGLNFLLNPGLFHSEIAKKMIAVVGLIYAIFLLYLSCFKKGTVGPNKYGEDSVSSENKTTISKIEKKIVAILLGANLMLFGIIRFIIY